MEQTKLFSKNKNTIVSLELCCNAISLVTSYQAQNEAVEIISPFGWQSLTNSASQQKLWTTRSHLERNCIRLYDSYTEFVVSTSGTRPVFLRPWGKQQRGSNHWPDGKYKGRHLPLLELLQESSGVQSSREMTRPPTVTVPAASIRKLSAKNLLPGLTGKVISLAGKVKTHKQNSAGWHYLLRSLLSPCRLPLTHS